MRQNWLNKNNNKSCILFFNGWGMDENAVNMMDVENYDVCMFNNYTTLETVDTDFTAYDNIILIAWSLGVWASEQVLPKLNIQIHKKIAINGTSKPVNNDFGIPESIFSNTLNNWNELNRNKFNARMMGGEKNVSDYASLLPKRNVAEQKEELESIYEKQQHSINSPLHWDVVLIGQNDLIFSETNQLNWWTGKTRIVKKEQPHFPFIGIRSWEQIVAI